MVNINFVPDDYIQKREMRRTNLIYAALFLMMMVGVGGSFGVIRYKSSKLDAEAEQVNIQMAAARESIAQLEKLQEKRRVMMRTALLTAELIEPVPRSVLLALLTNELPGGVSLLRLKLVQKESKNVASSAGGSKYAAVSASGEQAKRGKTFDTLLEIEGLAPTDIQVASYIANLGNSFVLDSVRLVHSKEHKKDEATFRQFKLTAQLAPDVHLSEEDIEKIKTQQDYSI